MKPMPHAFVLAVILIAAGWAPVLASDDTGTAESAAPDGILCLTPVQNTSYLAIRVPLTSVQAISGVRWFNNDSGTIYPRLLVSDGQDEAGPNLEIAQTALENFAGASGAWSDVTLSAPVTSDGGSLYVVFQLPANSEYVHQGASGGPGFGYLHQDQSAPVYLSPDGQDWVRLNVDYRLLVEPVLVARSPEMGTLEAKNLAHKPTTTPVERPYLNGVFPNPSNPATNVEFSTGKAGWLSLSIYDIRGRLVRTLFRGAVDPGTYLVKWPGDDEAGRAVASGAYFVRLSGMGELASRRLTLVR